MSPNKEQAMASYKAKWGLTGYRFWYYGSGQLYICAPACTCRICFLENDKEIKCLSTLMATRKKSTICTLLEFDDSRGMNFDGWDSFLEYTMIKKLTGL